LFSALYIQNVKSSRKWNHVLVQFSCCQSYVLNYITNLYEGFCSIFSCNMKTFPITSNIGPALRWRVHLNFEPSNSKSNVIIFVSFSTGCLIPFFQVEIRKFSSSFYFFTCMLLSLCQTALWLDCYMQNLFRAWTRAAVEKEG